MFSSFISNWGPTIASVGGSMLANQGNSAPSVPQLPYQDAAANNAFGDISSLNNPYPTMQPLEYQQLMAYMNNPYLAPYMKAAGQAGDMYGRAGAQARLGSNLLMKDARGIYQSSFDPRNQLYDRLAQQNQDQSAVTNSMYGLDTSPYGAGVAGQHLNDFNIDWQNQQLQRQIAGAGAIGQNVAGAQNLLTGGAQDYLKSGLVPYSAYTGALGDMTGAINGYMSQAQQGNVPTQMAIGDWLQYLGMGNANAATNLAAFNTDNTNAANTAAALYPMFQQSFQNWGSSSGGGNGGFTPMTGTGYDSSYFSNNYTAPVQDPIYGGGP